MNNLHLAIVTYSRHFDSFLDDVCAALPDSDHAGAKPGAKTVRELAIVLGATDTQTREWFVNRKYLPSGPVAFKALLWLYNRKRQRGAVKTVKKS